MKILVTGGAGFIGSHLVRHMILCRGWRVLNVDALTYAGHVASLGDAYLSGFHDFERVDIADEERMEQLVSRFQPDAVMHLAAESHVDRSVDGPGVFVRTNVQGTYVLLEACRKYWQALDEVSKQRFRFVHVSTDEVYGSLGKEGLFHEDMPYAPSSAYSASKAASDHLALAWHRTYGLPVTVTHCSNNYGPNQLPEKLIPLMVLNAMAGRSLPVYGTGSNVRDWIHVQDHVSGLVAALQRGIAGEVYNFGGDNELRNIDVVGKICDLMDEERPLPDDRRYSSYIEFVTDRPGHDLRYAVCNRKAFNELGWQPSHSFDTGLRQTVLWYLNNQDWCEKVCADGLSGSRSGLSSVARLAA
jgi:dTDP-glucose 4,6-dehydratase